MTLTSMVVEFGSHDDISEGRGASLRTHNGLCNQDSLEAGMPRALATSSILKVGCPVARSVPLRGVHRLQGLGEGLQHDPGGLRWGYSI
jgi:hypothetical protein